jgi:subfamily B ATP-binding cassette protein MsbA
MNNLARAFRLTLRYRGRLAAAMSCAAMVAILWGTNIGTVYPLIEIVITGKSPAEWAESQVRDTSARMASARVRIALEQAREVRATDAAAAERILADAETALKNDDVFVAVPDIARAELAGKLSAARAESTPYDRSSLRTAQTQFESERTMLASRRFFQTHVVPWLPDDAFKTVALVVSMLLIGTIIKGLFLIANITITTGIVGLVVHDLRNQFYRRALQMDQAAFSRDGTTDLMSRFTYDIDCVASGLQLICSSVVLEPLKIVCCLIGAAWINWRLLTFSLIVVPIGAILIRQLSKSLKAANRKAMEGMSKIYGVLAETFQGIAVVKAFTMERHERRRFHEANKQYFLKSQKIARYDAWTNPFTEWMGMITVALTLLAGLYLAVNNETHLFGIRLSSRPPGVAELLLFYGLLAGISDPLRKLSGTVSRLQRASAAADRVYAMMDRECQVRDPEEPIRLPRHRRELAFKNVNFEYRPGAPVLANIDLVIPRGQRVALVGANGCGKSTLVNLIPRFYDPCQGQVLVDGCNIREARIKDVREQIGLVTQEPFLFNDTVYNNIRYGFLGATRAQVIAAAKKAHAHRFIEERLPQGYESMVGERGGTLSGGQRQRIALARAILRDPSILILDEATSQIDVESEQLIHMALEEFIQDRTTLVITHRSSTLALVDRIVVMDHGRIVDDGSHEQLLRRCGFYQSLYREAA